MKVSKNTDRVKEGIIPYTPVPASGSGGSVVIVVVSDESAYPSEVVYGPAVQN